jgi:phosphoribosyl-ATP pyrophosphohydrolase
MGLNMNHKDYTAAVLKKTSPLFNTESVSAPEMLGLMRDILAANGRAEAVRKYVYYGRTISPGNKAWLHSHRDTNDVLDYGKIDPDLLHGAMGLLDEAGEMLLQIRRVATGEIGPDAVNWLEEIGDAFFFLTLLMHKSGLTLPQVMAANLAKLAVRHGEVFSADGANHRDPEAERAALQAHVDELVDGPFGLSGILPASPISREE